MQDKHIPALLLFAKQLTEPTLYMHTCTVKTIQKLQKLITVLVQQQCHKHQHHCALQLTQLDACHAKSVSFSFTGITSTPEVVPVQTATTFNIGSSVVRQHPQFHRSCFCLVDTAFFSCFHIPDVKNGYMSLILQFSLRLPCQRQLCWIKDNAVVV